MNKTIPTFLLLIVCGLCVQAQVNDIFLKNAAKEVWSMNAPQFDASRSIPDSLQKNNSAVVIASLDIIEAEFAQGESALKGRKLGNRITNLTRRKVITRKMTKLLDNKAVEDNSTIEIAGGDMSTLNNYEMYSANYADGVRVHKPDGRVEDIDVSKALSVTSGKDGDKENGRVLQIPGLEVGDVVETFSYVLEEMDELSLQPLELTPIDKYPVLDYEMRGKFSPYLTVEYNRVNGAPVIAYSTDAKENFVMNLRLKDLPAAPKMKWFNRARQIPYYRFQTLNNNTDMVRRSKVARGPGLYPNIPAATYYREIAEVLTRVTPDADLVKNVEKHMKGYIKNHPDENRRNLIDKTYITLMYYLSTTKDLRTSGITRAVALRECLHRLKLDDSRTGVGFLNSRRSFPTDCLLQYSDVDYVVVAGDSAYQTTYVYNLTPGEFPQQYQGEAGAVFYSDFKNVQDAITLQPARFALGTTTFSNNVMYSDMTLDIDTDTDAYPISFKRKVRATGTHKMTPHLPFDKLAWLRAMEDYLEMPENQRYVDDGSLVLEEEKVNECYLEDVEKVHGVRPTRITAAEIASLGSMPDNKKTEYSVEGIFEDFAADAGDGDIYIPIGKLFGKNDRILGNDRNRSFDADMGSPGQYIYKISLNIPEGYSIDQQSLEQMNANMQRPAGCFTASAALDNDGRQLVINVINRVNSTIVPSKRWKDLLDITDTAASFNEVSILLTRTK